MVSYLKTKLYNLLRYSERFLNLDMIYVAKGGLWTTVSFLSGLVASIASMIAFGNLLPKESYGTYNYLLSLGASLSFLTLSGIGPVVIRLVAKGQENVLDYALRFQLKYNLLATATILVVGIYYGVKGNSLFAISLGILSLVIPMESAYHVFEHILIGRKRFDRLAIFTSFSSIASALATVVALFFTDSVLVLIIVYATLSFAPSYITYKLVTKNAPKDKPSEEEIASLRRSSFHITGAGLIGAVAQYIDKIILFQVAGPASLAIYSFAIAGPERLKGLIKNWIGIGLPRLSGRDVIEIHAVFYKRVGLSIILGSIMAVTYIVFTPILFHLLLPKYLLSIHYSQVYALGLIFSPALVYIGNIFYSQNMLRSIYITSTVNQIVRICLFALLALLWQTWGLVIAFLISQIFGVLFCILIWEKERHTLV